MIDNLELNGAWEEPGVIGTRIEIEDYKIKILWRNSPVLVTTYKLINDGNGVELQLKNNGLRYENAESDYATVKRIFYKDGVLEFTEDFPISGESTEKMKKTKNSRFGNVTIVDEVLEKLQGTWVDEDNIHEVIFKQDNLSMDGRTIKIHVVHQNWESAPNSYRIVDQNPSKYSLFDFIDLEYRDGELISKQFVFDAPPIITKYVKKRQSKKDNLLT